ncbi:MAG: glycosyltransferase, partial [Candidatus Dadabacteria bacterium]|nr:glycosyltransferase [Candidatus Dadabacteria bacterium]
AEILSVSDIGLLISHQEGFSNAILEGMACALPMIVTDVGGNSEAIVHEKCGLLVKPCDPEGLSIAILKIINDKETARLYGKSARERVQKYFSLDQCVKNYNELFQHLM